MLISSRVQPALHTRSLLISTSTHTTCVFPSYYLPSCCCCCCCCCCCVLLLRPMLIAAAAVGLITRLAHRSPSRSSTWRKCEQQGTLGWQHRSNHIVCPKKDEWQAAGLRWDWECCGRGVGVRAAAELSCPHSVVPDLGSPPCLASTPFMDRHQSH